MPFNIGHYVANKIHTFEACTVVGQRCYIPMEARYIKNSFYRVVPYCFNTDPAKPKQIQCLPKGFQSILPPETTDVNIRTIKNSIFDNCSPTDGADAGCGKNLQCNYYKNDATQRWICEPVWQPISTNSRDRKDGINLVGTKWRGSSKYEVANWHQTCGTSQFSHYLDIQCDQKSTAGPLVCSPVSAYVKGVIATKSICITPAEDAILQKRRVSNVFCYSGCPAYGAAAKQV